MTWELYDRITLRNERVPDADADRQLHTAAEILRRFASQPGVILADEVGMGKTYVALAVAVSVIEATGRRHPVVVMVPTSVATKWPLEWSVFSDRCLPAGHGLRATGPIRSGSEFLKRLDDPASRRSHLIFLTHGALTRNLSDPWIRLALLRRATLRRPKLIARRPAIARAAKSLLGAPHFDERTTMALLQAPEARWRKAWESYRPDNPISDDPVPFVLAPALRHVDLDPLRDAIESVPVHRTDSYPARLREARAQLTAALNDVWTDALGSLDLRLPLLILDEAHHVKNRNQLARLLDNEEAERDAAALHQGPLGNKFEKMMFLTATPFQLGHKELLSVLNRFHGIRWPSARARTAFDLELEQLQATLDRAQASTQRFQSAWGRIDLLDADRVETFPDAQPADGQPTAIRSALVLLEEAETDVREAEALLRPWVIRHVRHDKAARRCYRVGRSILDDAPTDLGLAVSGPASLPFLLAARVEAVAALQGGDARRSVGAYFTYGLASSFEAYRDTRANRKTSMDDQDDGFEAPAEPPPQIRWYLDRIDRALPATSSGAWAGHPKMAATVERVRQLWCVGEKVVVFCFYVQTGRALRSHISRVLNREIVSRAVRQLGMEPAEGSEVLSVVARIAERLLDRDTRGFRVFESEVRRLASGLDAETQAQVVEIVTRFMRTPSFLVRFVDLSPGVSIEAVVEALHSLDGSGVALADRITRFASLLRQTVEAERKELLAALGSIQTGGIAATDRLFDPSERMRRRDVLLPNVRLANGGVKSETRHRLMIAFNTPFFPEVLVASSVMSEGVDLHQDCRFVIHHDLDWNPSVLEQRTGRVDRISSKAERSSLPVVVYEPYVGGTHDERQFRVVKDRERWFAIVMGDSANSGPAEGEGADSHVPLPLELAKRLTVDLSLQP